MHSPRRWPGVIVQSFWTATLLFTCGYVGRFPMTYVGGLAEDGTPDVGADPTHEPLMSAPALLVVLGLVFLHGAFRVSRVTAARPWLSGAYYGALVHLISLLVFLSVAKPTSEEVSGGLQYAWLSGGFIALGALVGALAAALGGRFGPGPEPSVNWGGRFAKVGVAATLVLIVIGGVVTSYEQGLAVPDWPTTFEETMFLFPLSKMLGGIYYEHTHRLFAFFVGVLTLTLSLFLRFHDRSKGVVSVALVCLALVVIQAVLGGYRVTMAEQGLETRASTALRVLHGITGQVFLGAMVWLATVASTGWRERKPFRDEGTSSDRRMVMVLAVLFGLQLTLGAMVRHIGRDSPWFHPHMLLAFILLFVALICGARLRGRHPERTPLRLVGTVLMHGVVLQFLLGWVAYIATGMVEQYPMFDRSATTLHQFVGAGLFAAVVCAFVLSRGLLAPSPVEAAASTKAERAT